jgi:diguanylate cyclase (GGDEF)-like protein/PAS domain S-box-containing protein
VDTINSGNIWRGEVPVRTKDGSTAWHLISIFPVLDENNQPYQFVSLRMDISEKKESEERTLKRVKQLNSIVEMTNDVMGCFDQNGTITYVNPASILGFTVSESVGTNIFDYIDFEDMGKVYTALEELKKKLEQSVTIEAKLKSKMGSSIMCEITLKNYLQDPFIQGIVFIYRDITEKKKISKEMKQIMFYDSLTGLPNRTNFENELTIEISQAINKKTSFVVMLLDVDDFQYVNDSLEFGVGDLLLGIIADRIKNVFANDEMLIYRIDGDEFAFILKDIFDQDNIQKKAEKLISCIKLEPFKINECEIFVTASLGVGIFPNSGEDVQTLLKNTEIALYQAKENGKNQYQIFTLKMDVFSYKQFTLRNDSKKALLNNEFMIYYQPRYNPVTNKMISAEALIRWNHPKWGMVSPVEFISIVERSGLILPLGTWIIRKVCLQIKKWEEEKIPVNKISINISALQLRQPDFVEIISSILDETAVKPEWIEFEITESVMIDNDEQVLKTMTHLRKLGITFALDDFGTGYSSLNYLRKFPFNIVKIDKSLIQDIHRDKTEYEIVEGIIALCHKLKKSVVAEGVELKEQLDLLKKLHCDEIQGYYFSKPINHIDFREQLKTEKWSANAEIDSVPKTNQRKFFRVPFQIPLVADMTIEKIGNKKLKIGNSEVFIHNIGPGGLSFQATLRLPVQQNITLQFTTEILSNMMQLNGHIVWHKELNDHDNEYGVKFILDEAKREELVKFLNQLQIQLRHKSKLPNSRFYEPTDKNPRFLIK